jgi:hypothetical protein
MWTFDDFCFCILLGYLRLGPPSKYSDMGTHVTVANIRQNYSNSLMNFVVTQNPNAAGMFNLSWSGFRLSLGVSSPTCQFGISNVFPFNYVTAVYKVCILLLKYE